MSETTDSADQKTGSTTSRESTQSAFNGGTPATTPILIDDDQTNTEAGVRFPIIAGIPAYNEASTIADIIKSAAPYVDEVVVVDDGSSDGTADCARTANATVIQHEKNKGYGAALGSLFDYAATRDADHLIILDGDGQHDPHDIPDLISQQVFSDAEIVIGSRFVGTTKNKTPLYRQFGLAIVNYLTNVGFLLTRSPLRVADTQSGFRAYNRTAIESMAAREEIGTGMDASLGILFHAAAHDFTVQEIPITVNYDVDDPNSHHPITHGLALLKRILVEIASKSMRQFIAGVGGSLALLLFLLVATDFIGQPIVGVAALVGIVVFVIAWLIARRHRQSEFRSIEQ